jgi:hypothetical protein
MVHFVDASFFSDQTSAFHLSGQVDAEGLAFAVTEDTGALKVLKRLACPHAVLSYDDWAKELTALFEQEPLLHAMYKSSVWTFLSNKATFIPSAFSDIPQLRKCLAYATPLDELDEVHYRALPDLQAILAFAVPSPPANVILKYQPGTRFLHLHAHLLSHFNTLQGNDRILLHVAPSMAYVELYRNNTLLLSNTCPFVAFTDVVYYLAFILQAYKLRSGSVALYYTGAVEEEQLQLLRRYYKNITSLYSSAAGLQVGEQAAVMYHPLLTLPQCE